MSLNHSSCQTRSRRPYGSDGQTVSRCLPRHASHEQQQQHLRKDHHQQPSTTTAATLTALTGQSAMATATTATLNNSSSNNNNNNSTTAAAACRNRRSHPAATSRRWRWRPRLALLPALSLVLLVLVRPSVTAPVAATGGTNVTTGGSGVGVGGKMLEKFLNATKDDWLKPCWPANGHGPSVNNLPRNTNGTAIDPAKIVDPMRATIQVALDIISPYELNELNGTNWSDEKHQKEYRFLRPFVSDESTWERRLSVYWAFLAFVVNVYETQSNVEPIKPAMLVDLRTLRNYVKDILCQAQEYRNVLNFTIQPIQAERMSKLIQYSEVDPGEIQVARWYILCRLNCYLHGYHHHLSLVLNGTQAAASPGKHGSRPKPSCRLCPYRGKGQGTHKGNAMAEAEGPHQTPRKQQHQQQGKQNRKQQQQQQQQQGKQNRKQQLGTTTNDQQRQQQQQSSPRKSNKKGLNGAGKKATNQAAAAAALNRRKEGKRGRKQQQQQQQQQRRQGVEAGLEGAAAVVKAPRTQPNHQAIKDKSNRKRKNQHQQGQGQGQQRHGGGGGKRPNRVQD